MPDPVPAPQLDRLPATVSDRQLDRLLELVSGRRLAVLTGAGISTERDSR